MRIPCGRVLGHGEFCSADNLCESCRNLKSLLVVREKAAALLARLDEISLHPSYKSQVEIACAHGHRYTGPTFEGTAQELRTALKASVTQEIGNEI